MKLIGRLLSAVIFLSAVVALCPSADAGAFTYAGKRKRINCGVAALTRGIDKDGNPIYLNVSSIIEVLPTQAENLFTKLDALTSMKPTGWTFENPLAATVDKFDPKYWIVPISSSRNLSRMDVLYFPGSSTISLTDEERENLRRFVDGGGVLWVDNAHPSSVLKFPQTGPLFISQCQFSLGGQPGSDFAVSRHHPLVSSPYWLTDIDIMSLGMTVADASWKSCYYELPGRDRAGGGMMPSDEPISYDFLYQVVDCLDSTGKPNFQPSVVANTYGSGRVVATARFVGKACLLREPYCLPSLKMAYNIMAYASSWTDIRKGPRHSGASIDTLGAGKLVEKWALKTGAGLNFSAEASKEAAPIIYKNTVFYTHNDTLYALDATGNNNFGLWGQPGPNGAVVIWKFPGDGGKLSAPAVATVQNPDQNMQDCAPIEAVMVQSSSGRVFILKAFPLNEHGEVEQAIVPLYDFPTQSGSSTKESKWPSPPIYINGWFYALGGNGRLYAENPCLKKYQDGKTPGPESAAAWQVPDTSQSGLFYTFTATPRCGPAFGYMKGLYSGAIVGSVWWYNSPRTDQPPTSQENDHMWAIPVAVSNDRPRVQSIDSARTSAELVVNFRGYIHAPDPNRPESAVTIFESDGVTPIPFSAPPILNKNLAGINAPGFITVHTTKAIPHSPRIYATFSLTYGANVDATTLNMQMEPRSNSSTAGPGGSFTVDPSTMHNVTTVAGSPAMGPDNMQYICGARVSQAPSDGGSILAYLNDGSTTGSGKLKWNYFLHSGLDSVTGPDYAPGMNVEIPGVINVTLRDAAGNPVKDPYGNDVRKSMIDPQPSASPAISNGKVFVTVSGKAGAAGSGHPLGALLCLKATPEFVIRICKNGGYDASGNMIKVPKNLYREGDHGHYHVKIWQPNLINSPSGAVPMMDAREVSGGARVDYEAGTITFSDFGQPRIQVRGGIETNNFSPSLPVWVFLDNVEVPIDWSTWGPGALVGNKPITAATSDTVDLSGWNNLLWYYVVPDSQVHSPPTVIGNTVYFVSDDGKLYALDAETGESKGQETAQKCVPQKIGTGNATMNPDASVSVAGSNGVLMVPGPDGLYAYTSTTTLVADNNRLIEVDGGGNATWSADSITWPANTPSATGKPMAIKQGPVNKPGRARYASTGEILFANTGADQVCKIDRSGMVGFDGASGLYARWIYDKFADPRHLLSSGQPLKLSGPTDAIMWQEIEPNPSGGSAPTSVVHCLIADSGNSRILDLVYRLKAGAFTKWDGSRIDPANNPADLEYIDQESGFVKPELNWASKTDALNERYSYNCIQLVNAVKGNNLYCQDVWVASSDISANGTDLSGTSPTGTASLGGAIMAIGYRQRTGGSQTSAPGDWDYSQTSSGSVVARCDRVQMGSQVMPLANPRYFDVVDTSAGRSLLICDNYGVYQVSISGSGIPPVMTQEQVGGVNVPINPLWNDVYTQLHRLEDPINSAPNNRVTAKLPGAPPLVASSVQRLPNHKWLVTNSYVGSNLAGDQSFNGEVFEYDPALGPNQEVLWCSPKLEWIDPLVTWKQSDTDTKTYNLRQPKSAIRQ